MGWFSGIGDALSGVSDWLGGNASWLVPAVGSVAGAVVGSNANADALAAQNQAISDAADTNAQSADAARKELADSKARGIAAINAGTQQYADTVAPMLTADYDGRGLTATQETQLDDLTRDGNAALAAGGLRGAGRAGPMSVMDSRGRFLNSARDSNLQRQDSARRGLAGIYAQQGNTIANTEIGVGSQSAGTQTAQGQTAENLALQGGQADANAGLADASLYSKTLGNLGALVNNQVETAKVDKYGQPKTTTTTATY